MNPFFMLNMMGLGRMPFSMGMNFFMPSFCCGSNFMMSMPYYNNDISFMNFPIFRNTSADYLLDPNLALQQCQQQWQMSGTGFGSTMLGGFTFPQVGTFAGIPAIGGLSTLNGTRPAVRQKTEEEVEAERKKEQEDRKPEAQKAKKLNELFNSIKKLSEDNNDFLVLDNALIQQAEEAMKKETAEEQLEAMQEVINSLPEDGIRKAILADSNIKEQLRRAGYNFNIDQNKYSFKNNDIKSNDLDHSDRIDQLYSDITEKNYNELQVITGQLQDANTSKTRILGLISCWNDKYNSTNNRSILRHIGVNLPTGNDAVGKTDAVKECTKVFTQALLAKADEYEGYPKIKKARIKVAKCLEDILKPNGFTKNNIYKLANAFDELYARLRMQEAVQIKDYIKNSYEYLNEFNENIINDQMVVEETQKDLGLEGITATPVNDLDETPEPEQVSAQKRNDDLAADAEYKDDPKALLEEYLVTEKGYLTAVDENSDIYKSIGLDGNDTFARYFKVDNGKLIEVTKKTDGTFEVPSEPKEVTAVDIGNFDASIKRAKRLIDGESIEEYKVKGFNKFPVFKATGANQFFAIIDGQFGKIKKGTKIEKSSLEKLTVNDLEVDYKDENIKSKTLIQQEKIEQENTKRAKFEASVQSVEEVVYPSLKEAKRNRSVDAISNIITGKDGVKDFKKLNVNGYFYSISQNKYYRYNEAENHLEYLINVVSISDDGYMKMKDGSLRECREAITDDVVTEEELISKIQDYGLNFAKSVSGPDNQNDYPNACRKLNTIIAQNNPLYTMNFIIGYQSNCHWYRAQDKGICKQIIEESGIKEGKNANELNSKKHYLREIAKLILNVVNVTEFDRSSDDYETLLKIADGEMVEGYLKTIKYNSAREIAYTGILGTAIALDNLIEKVLKAYNEATQ